MDRERLDNWCERGILGLVMAMLVFAPLATGAVRPLEFSVLLGLCSAALILWLLRLWLQESVRILMPPVAWAVLLFVAYAIYRCREADLEYVARTELLRILLYAAVFFLIVNNLNRQESIRWIAYSLIFLGMAVSMYAVYQFATNSDRVWHFIKPSIYLKRGSGTYICPNHLAGFLEMLLPLALAYVFTGRVPALLRVFLGYAALMMMAGIAVTLSRGGWVATAVSLLAFFGLLACRRQYRWLSLALVLLLAGGALLFYQRSTAFRQRLQATTVPGTPHHFQIRQWLTTASLEMWRDHFWWGVGPGHFDARFPAYRSPLAVGRPGYAHNDYLNALTDWGVAGAGLIALIWGLGGMGIWRAWRYVNRDQSDLGTKPSNRAAFVLGATTGLLALLVHALIDFNFQIPANALIAFSLFALLASHARFSSERYWITLRVPGRAIATGLLVATTLYLLQMGWRRASENHWLSRAARETQNSPALFAALERAAAIEPTNPETPYTLGEAYRQASWQGGPDYVQQAEAAVRQFDRAIQLNPFDPYSPMKRGMCLDWLGRHDEAEQGFVQAVRLDPNNYYVVAHLGWHFVQTGAYAAAKREFMRSINLFADPNPVAQTYFRIVNRKLEEQAAGAPPQP